jgi:hypothetical protein
MTIPQMETLPACTRRVFVYRNLNASKKHNRVIYSVRDIQTGRVVGHAENVWLADVVFKVGEAGRDRVRREKSKNVHAGITGIPVPSVNSATWRSATYNPYRYDTFVDRETGSPLLNADNVHLSPTGVYYRSA